MFTIMRSILAVSATVVEGQRYPMMIARNDLPDLPGMASIVPRFETGEGFSERSR